MRPLLRNSLLACAVVAAGILASPRHGAAEPLQLRWEHLIPAPPSQSALRNLVAKVSLHRQLPMSERVSMSVSAQPDLVSLYDGQQVRISGFILPFNNDEEPYKRLLLIPFSDACVKFPPPRNQAILITYERGFRFSNFADRVAVTGVMNVETAVTDIAETGYRISADAIDLQE